MTGQLSIKFQPPLIRGKARTGPRRARNGAQTGDRGSASLAMRCTDPRARIVHREFSTLWDQVVETAIRRTECGPPHQLRRAAKYTGILPRE